MSFDENRNNLLEILRRWILAMAPTDKVMDLLLKSYQEHVKSVSLTTRDSALHVSSNIITDNRVLIDGIQNICDDFSSILLSILPFILNQHKSPPPLDAMVPYTFESSSASITHFQDPSLAIQLAYIRNVILRFVSKLNEIHHSIPIQTGSSAKSRLNNIDVADILMENDDISFLFIQLNRAKILMDIPNPNSYCHVSFFMPKNKISSSSLGTKTTTNNTDTTTIPQLEYNPSHTLTLRMYPYHNDVGVRKVWEAGCCLAEFLYMYPLWLQNKLVIEIGSGVGLTGLFVAQMCQPFHIHMTDVTSYCLDNLQYNLSIQYNDKSEQYLHETVHKDVGDSFICSSTGIMKQQQLMPSTYNTASCHISIGYFNWKEEGILTREIDEYTHNYNIQDGYSVTNSGYSFFQNAHVLLAADVLYDRDDIPYLVQTIYTFLSHSSSSVNTSTTRYSDEKEEKEDELHQNLTQSKVAIFATTIRNQETFQLFEQSVSKMNIHAQMIPTTVIDNLPEIFPCYFLQPRSDIRITLFTLSI